MYDLFYVLYPVYSERLQPVALTGYFSRGFWASNRELGLPAGMILFERAIFLLMHAPFFRSSIRMNRVDWYLSYYLANKPQFCKIQCHVWSEGLGFQLIGLRQPAGR